MKKKACLLPCVVFSLTYGVPASARDVCGDPPPAQFRETNNEAIKGDLTGKANLLTRFIGDAELGGKIDATRNEVFAEYKDANAAYMDRYLVYMFCHVLFDPANKQSTEEKLKAIREYGRQQQQDPTNQSARATFHWKDRGFNANWAGNDSASSMGFKPKLSVQETSLCDAEHVGQVVTCWNNRPSGYPPDVPTDITGNPPAWCAYKGEGVNDTTPSDDKAPRGHVSVCEFK